LPIYTVFPSNHFSGVEDAVSPWYSTPLYFILFLFFSPFTMVLANILRTLVKASSQPHLILLVFANS